MSLLVKRRRIAINGFLSSSTWLLPALLSFLITPIMIGTLGPDRYGLYILVLGFVGNSFTFGIGKATVKYVAEFTATGKDTLVSEAVSATFWISVLIGCTGAVLTAVLSGFLVDGILQIPKELSNEGRQGLLIAAVIILITMVSQVWSSVLQGLHHFGRLAAITMLGSVLTSAGVIVLAVLRYDIFSLLAWNLLVTCLLGAIYFRAVMKAAPRILIRLRVERDIGKAILGYSTAIILSQIFSNILLQIERAWITRHHGVDALTYYVVPMTLGILLHTFISSLVFVLFPIINEVLDDTKRVNDLYRSSTKLVLAIVSFAVITSAVIGRAILSTWVGEQVAAEAAPILAIHMATFGLLGASTVAWYVGESFRKASASVWFSIGVLIVATTLFFVLGGSYGLEGVAAARLLGSLGIIPLIIFVEIRVLRSPEPWFWLTSIIRLLPGLAAAGITQAAIDHWFDDGAAVMGGLLAGGSIFTLSLLVIKYFETEELNWFRRSLSPSKLWQSN